MTKDKENLLLKESEPLFAESLEHKSAWDCLDPAKDNPFYSNHVFTDADLQRKALKITWSERFILFFLPTLVQISLDSNRVFHYKMWGGRYYLIKEEVYAPTKDNRFYT